MWTSLIDFSVRFVQRVGVPLGRSLKSGELGVNMGSSDLVFAYNLIYGINDNV